MLDAWNNVPEAKRSVVICLIVGLVTVCTFSRVSTFDFVAWDDMLHVYQNPYLQPFNFKSLLHFWQHPYYSLYIPISYMVFGLISLIAGGARNGSRISAFDTNLNPHLFHDANLLLHAANAVLVYLLVKKTVKSELPSALGAMLFALHPLQVESVAWISELRGLLSAVFALSGMLLFQQSEDDRSLLKPKLLFAHVLFALSLLAKPSVVMVPFVLLIWQTLFRRVGFRETLKKLTPWFVLATLDTVKTHMVQPVTLVAHLTLWQRLLVAFDSLGFYVEKLLWPFNLSIEYGRTPQIVIEHHLEIATISCLLASFTVCAVAMGKHRWVLGCVLVFVLFLLPETGIIPFAYQYVSTVADRYAYMALLGPALAVAFVLNGTKLKWQGAIFYGIVISVLLGLQLVSFQQLSTWKNTETLFANAVVVNPSDWLPREKLGNEYLRLGKYGLAAKQFRVVVENGPTDSDFWLKLGQAEEGDGQIHEAILAYDKCLSMSPSYYISRYGRAECEAMNGESKLSIADYRAVIGKVPSSDFVDYEYAKELLAVGNTEAAETEFGRAITRHPDFMPGYYFLAATYEKLGKPVLASDVASLALARDPKFVIVLRFVKTTTAIMHLTTLSASNVRL